MNEEKEYLGHPILESFSALPSLTLACGQNAQLAMHFPGEYVIKNAVVKSGLGFPLSSPSWIAVPRESLTSSTNTIVLTFHQSAIIMSLSTKNYI